MYPLVSSTAPLGAIIVSQGIVDNAKVTVESAATFLEPK